MTRTAPHALHADYIRAHVRTVIEGAAIVDLPELGGSQRLIDGGLPLFTLVDFAGH